MSVNEELTNADLKKLIEEYPELHPWKDSTLATKFNPIADPAKVAKIMSQEPQTFLAGDFEEIYFHRTYVPIGMLSRLVHDCGEHEGAELPPPLNDYTVPSQPIPKLAQSMTDSLAFEKRFNPLCKNNSQFVVRVGEERLFLLVV